jgi:hypothetical protein
MNVETTGAIPFVTSVEDTFCAIFGEFPKLPAALTTAAKNVLNKFGQNATNFIDQMLDYVKEKAGQIKDTAQQIIGSVLSADNTQVQGQSIDGIAPAETLGTLEIDDVAPTNGLGLDAGVAAPEYTAPHNEYNIPNNELEEAGMGV